jgi:phosphatidylglycerophosphatase C
VYSLDRSVSPEDPPPAVVAAFDVDGTLTTRDCVTPFLRELAGSRLGATLARHPLVVALAVARRDNDALKELACTALEGLDATDVAERGAAYARRIRGAWMRPDTLARLDRHRALGHVVVLVSASLEPYLDPLGTLLGADAVLCTRLEVGDDGRLTGRLAGRNCRGPEKAVRLRAWLEERRLGDATVWAYGDSRGDRELLALADRAELVKGRRLGADTTLALTRGTSASLPRP